MGASEPSSIDLSLRDPAGVVHAVADVLAGRRVELAWISCSEDDGLTGVGSGVVEVHGCIAAPGQPIIVVGVDVVDDRFVSVAWGDLLAADPWTSDAVSYTLRRRLIEVSRWFGHTVQLTTCDQERIVAPVIGFDLAGPFDGVEVILARSGRPSGHPSCPDVDDYAVPFDELVDVVDWGC